MGIGLAGLMAYHAEQVYAQGMLISSLTAQRRVHGRTIIILDHRTRTNWQKILP